MSLLLSSCGLLALADDDFVARLAAFLAKLQAQLANLGGTALGGSPADFAKLISDEVKKWSRVVLAANMKRE